MYNVWQGLEWTSYFQTKTKWNTWYGTGIAEYSLNNRKQKADLIDFIFKQVQSWTKHLQTFSGFSTISLHHKWKPFFYQQKVNVSVASRVADLKFYDIRKFQENHWNAWN